VLVLLDEVRSSHERIVATDIAAGVALDYALPIEPLVLSVGELDRLRRLETALGRALDAEGVRV
jgi:hypothetical protein